ncbi:maltose ABC transporter permease MalF [Actibacterium sp. 188UL27-1]|uniref:maltose ABC transporter permease MalF n=1 Tax=Actibacterium sp. 188UL27-1 TaxID=2786961 RepID=UPI00351C409E
MNTPADRPVSLLSGSILRWAGLGGIALIFLYVVWGLYLAGEPVFAVVMFTLGSIATVLFGWARFYTWRFVFPAVAAVALFILLPVLYTSAIGFTNFSARNLLTFERVQDYHLARMDKAEGSARAFGLTEDRRLYFPPTADQPALITDPLTDAEAGNLTATVAPVEAPGLQAVREVIKNRAVLQTLSVTAPDGSVLTMDGLREFAAAEPLYILSTDGVLLAKDGGILTPNHKTGFYQTADGQQISPGWRVGVGWQNFNKVLTSDGVRQPMLQIFLWTVVFAFLSMALTFAVGTALAVILDWQHLSHKGLYRVLLVLPYAVPGFISILVFRGLFNQNFGEINMILTGLFGIKPTWFTDPVLAKTMLLIVNTWLGYPYWMLLIGGFLQAVPQDHYKAAALDGSGPVRNFFAITLPQILPPSVPLLIANFAFNFNNVVLILLLTRGGPDIPGTIIPAGSTDLLGSFTFRLAFNDSGQDFGMAGAISTIIFLITGIIAYANFRVMQRVAAKRSARG